MDRVKIVHTSDLHLDSRLTGLDSIKRDRRRLELKQSFSAVVDFALSENTDIFLLGGDVFDSEHVEKDTLVFLKNEFARLGHIPVFISAGNHDPLSVEAYKYLKDNCGDNLHIFGGEISSAEIKDKNVRVYGYGFETEHIAEPVLSGFKAEDDGMINIMLLHGEICDGGKMSDYNPIYVSDIEKSGLDYLALGHTHTYSGIQKAGGTHFAYCGTHEGHGFDECGQLGIIAGYVGKGKTELEFVPTCKRQYQHIDIDITNLETTDDIVRKISEMTKPKNLYKIRLVGYTESSINVNLLNDCIDCFYAEIEDDTHIRYDLDDIAGEYNLKSLVASKLKESLEAADDEETKILTKCADILMSIFEKGEI